MNAQKANHYMIISIVAVIIVLIIWQLATDVFQVVPSTVFPSPLTIAKTFAEKTYNPAPEGSLLHNNIVISVSRALSGFAIANLIGIPLGICMAWFSLTDKIFRPLFNFVRAIPPIAIIPLFIVLFGIGTSSKVALVVVACVPVCILNAYAGIKQTSDVHIWAANVYGASNKQLLFKVAIPSAGPMIFTGVRTSMAISWIALIGAEIMAATDGLGYMIQMGRSFGKIELIITGILTIALVAMAISFLLNHLEKKLIKNI